MLFSQVNFFFFLSIKMLLVKSCILCCTEMDTGTEAGDETAKLKIMSSIYVIDIIKIKNL